MSDKTARTKEEIIAEVLGWESFSPGPVMADTDDFLKAMEEYRQSSPVEKWVSVDEEILNEAVNAHIQQIAGEITGSVFTVARSDIYNLREESFRAGVKWMETQRRWLSVKDCKPEMSNIFSFEGKQRPVLIANEDGEMDVATYTSLGFPFVGGKPAILWQPLPELPPIDQK